MRSAFFELSPNRRVTPLRDRVVAIAVAIGIEVLIVLALLTLGGHVHLPRRQNDLETFSVLPSPDRGAAAKPSPRMVKPKPKPAAKTPPTPHSTIPVPPTPITLPGVIPMNLADNDLSKVPTHKSDDAPVQEKPDVEQDSASAYGPGAGPGGERLYNARWYREPTHAELSYYAPKASLPPGAIGWIDCRTIEHYHVDDCRELGESPVGSGIARMMRQAAWQFLIRPPHVNGRVMVGERVNVCWEIITKGAPSRCE